MNSNEDSTFLRGSKIPSDAPNSNAPSKKTVDQFLDEMDAWDKIAAELDADAQFDADAVSADWKKRTPRELKPKRDDKSSPVPPVPPQRLTKPGSYLVQYDDVDKIAEDYETRARRRERSVWNNGDWRRDKFDGPETPKRPNENADGEFNGLNRSNNNGDARNAGTSESFGDRRSYFRRSNRGGSDFERPSERRYDGYRSEGFRNNYRNSEQHFSERRDGDRRPDDRRSAYQPNYYCGGERRQDDVREYRPSYGSRGEFGNDRDSSRDFRESDRRSDTRERNDSNGEFRENNRRYSRSFDRDGSGQNYRSNGGRFERRGETVPFDGQSNYQNSYQNDDRDSFDRRRPRFYGERTESLEPTIGARGKRGEPLSLAEEIAARQHKSRRSVQRRDVNSSRAANDGGEFQATLDANERNENALAATSDDASELKRENVAAFEATSDTDRQIVAELEQMEPSELVAEARRQNLETPEGERFHDLVVRVLRARLRQNGLMYGEGTLEILPDEFGFLRSPNSRYLSCPDDIYISPSQIRRFGLRNGLTIFGQIRPPKERERYFALLRVETINNLDPNALASKPFFDELIPVHPNERIVLESLSKGESQESASAETTTEKGFDARILDLLAPLGFGQRGLLVAPPRSGTTTIIQKTAQSVLDNYPDSNVFIVLVDERPEEITEMERKLRGPRCEVVGSTFDETPSRHIQIAEIALEKAKRMVEYGQNVVLFLDSLTRLTRAWNAERTEPGQPTPTNLDPAVLQRPKKYFGSARKIDGGGSLTIFATINIGDGVQFDDDVLEEFKGTANLEIWLDRALADKRIWPPLDVAKSGSRREETILGADEYRQIGELRRRLAGKTSDETLIYLRDELAKTKTNAEFLATFDVDKDVAQ